MGMSMKVKRSTLEDVRSRFITKKAEMETKEKEYDLKERLEQVREEESRIADYRRLKKSELRKRKLGGTDGAQLEDDGGSEMAAMMGFGGFGTSKKTN